MGQKMMAGIRKKPNLLREILPPADVMRDRKIDSKCSAPSRDDVAQAEKEH